MVLGVASLAIHQQQEAHAAFQTAERLFPHDSTVVTLASTIEAMAQRESALPQVRGLAIALARVW